MLDFFREKKNHFIGIDFGTSSIKIVELSYKSNDIYLENYGIADLNSAAFNEQNGEAEKSSSYEKKLNDFLKKLIEKVGLKAGIPAYVSIPGFIGLITILELPNMQKEELAKAIQFEAHKYIPSSLDEIAMSWEIIQKADSNTIVPEEHVEKKLKVLLVAAPKRDIEHYNRLVSDTKLEVNAIELETFSIVRSLVGEDPGRFLVIDIGYRATNIILVEKGTIVMNRNIDAGGNEITSAISDSMSISKQRAEIFKRGERDLLNSKEMSFIVPILDFITSESNRILKAYKEKNKEARIDGILLSGGASKMRGIEEYFSKAIGAKVMIGNPWRRIKFQEDAAPLVEDLGASFTVALGLALRGVEEYKRK